MTTTETAGTNENVPYTATYIWLDGTQPTAQIRAKTRVIGKSQLENPPVWSFDGSSTNQAEGTNSDMYLRPVRACLNPLRQNSAIILCEVYDENLQPYKTNYRATLRETIDKNNNGLHNFWFAFEQEYTLFKEGSPLANSQVKTPDDFKTEEQGQYYCGVGSSNSFGRQLAEAHLTACMQAGLSISGINAEVAPGQWEFQMGPGNPVAIADETLIARYLLELLGEMSEIDISYDPKPLGQNYNGAGMHANFSTEIMRNKGGIKYIEQACEALSKDPAKHLAVYGHDYQSRLTGEHETCSYETFRYAYSDRTASVRIPGITKTNGFGYVEDRRPNANANPYQVANVIVQTVAPEVPIFEPPEVETTESISPTEETQG